MLQVQLLTATKYQSAMEGDILNPQDNLQWESAFLAHSRNLDTWRIRLSLHDRCYQITFLQTLNLS